MSSSTRSGMISDLNSLVNEAKLMNSSNSLDHKPLLASSTIRTTASSRGGGGGGGGDDNASLSSFSRSIARVARAVEDKDNLNGSSKSIRSLGSLSRRSNALPPPPPPSPRYYEYTNPSGVPPPRALNEFDIDVGESILTPTPTPGINPHPYANNSNSNNNSNNNNSFNTFGSHSHHSSGRAGRTPRSPGGNSSRRSMGGNSNSSYLSSGSGSGHHHHRSVDRGSVAGSGSGAASTSTRSSNATERLMSLVNELSSQPQSQSQSTTNSNNSNNNRPPPPLPPSDPSVSSANSGGYLPNQYEYGNNNGNSNGNNERRGIGRTQRGSDNFSHAGSATESQRSHHHHHHPSSRNSNTTDPSVASGSSGRSSPTGFIMPPGGSGNMSSSQSSVASTIGRSMASGDDNDDDDDDDATSANRSLYSAASGPSMMSSTSAGQSTMPSEYPTFGTSTLGPPHNGSVAASGTNNSVTYSMNMAPPATTMMMMMNSSAAASAPGGGSSPGMMEQQSYMDQSYISGVMDQSYISGSQDQSYIGGGGGVGQQQLQLQPQQQQHVDFMSQQQQSMGGMGDTYISGAHSGSTPPGSYVDPYGQHQQQQSYVQQMIPGAGAGGMMMYGSGPGMGSATSQLGGDGSTFGGSKGSRSLANSAALIPRAKFSWASESVGTQSTVLTRRSINTSSVPEPHHEREGSKVVAGRMWASFAWIITFPIPNKCIMRPTKDAKQAWREKVALFVIMVSCSVFFVGVFGFVPLLLCKEDTIFSMQDIWLQTGESWVVVHGVIYDVKDLIYRHPGGVKGIVDYLGKDGSKVFPRAPPVTLPQKCLDNEKIKAFNLNVYRPDNNFTNPTCASFSELDLLLGVTCHTFAAGSNGTAKFLGDYETGVLSHTTVGLNSDGRQWFGLYDRVYDVTNYVKAINENREPTLDEEDSSLDNNPAAYLTPTLNKVIMNSLGGDATDLYEALFGSSEYIACLEEMFYAGLLDDEFDTFCYTLNIMMYVMLVFVATLMVIQFIASMIYICPRHRTYSKEDVMSPVMVMVPCYNEGDNELRKTIKSVLNTTYPDENKVLFMVADGLVTGNGEDMSSPEHLANILGFDIDEFEDDTFEYDCIGVIHTKNRARVYHGILQKGHKFLKYITIVKCGLPEEAATSAKPGNRGKRDSQLVVMGYYNRIHYGRELTELDSAIQRAMVDLNLQADMVRFLMAIDADTRVDTMSITHMVYAMDKKEKVLALCGETKVDNKASSWVTMIQVFEYYNSHHLKKAFEAAFGCVTCLPGCFTMYRIIADDGTPLLPGDGVLYEYSRNDIETLHEKNLYHLGEDRMLTTLLLKYYPDRSLTFIPEAVCWTIVPHTFRILLSQRRRWINSTVHNMFELLKVNTMCGVCCVSMKVVVFIDLLATMILPASYIYAMYLLFLVFFEDLPVSTVLLILYGIIMGVQIVVFILRSRWEYLWWFAIYFVIGLPVFYLILPTYAFWNMDDFSWGKTRSVGGNAALSMPVDEDDDDEEDDSERYDETYPLNADDNTARRDDDDDMHSTGSSDEGSGSSEEEDGVYGSEEEDGVYERSYKDDDDETEFSNSMAERYKDDDDETEFSNSMAESEYFSRASQMQESRYSRR